MPHLDLPAGEVLVKVPVGGFYVKSRLHVKFPEKFLGKIPQGLHAHHGMNGGTTGKIYATQPASLQVHSSSQGDCCLFLPTCESTSLNKYATKAVKGAASMHQFGRRKSPPAVTPTPTLNLQVVTPAEPVVTAALAVKQPPDITPNPCKRKTCRLLLLLAAAALRLFQPFRPCNSMHTLVSRTVLEFDCSSAGLRHCHGLCCRCCKPQTLQASLQPTECLALH